MKVGKPVLSVLFWLALPVTAAPSSSAPLSNAPFDLRFDEKGIGRGISPKKLGDFDGKLSGYRIEAPIATLLIRPRHSSKLPRKLVLAIRTSSGMAPMLESFALIWPDLTIQTALAKAGAAGNEEVHFRKGNGKEEIKMLAMGTYFRLRVVGEEVRVTFLPRAMKLLKKPCKIQWIDWYRG